MHEPASGGDSLTDVRQAQPPLPARRDQPVTYPAPLRVRGRLIAVEGVDGSGKSTQIRLLLHWLEDAGLPAHLTSWNSSPVVHGALRRAKRDATLTPHTFSLMHAADLADRLEREILPRLRAGQVVLADRWVSTAFARDAARGCAAEWLQRLYAFAPRPHLSVYFRVPVAVATERILNSRQTFGYYEAGLDLGLATDAAESFRAFQGRVQERYDALVGPQRLRIIDGCLPASTQQAEFRRLAERTLVRRGLRSEAAGSPGPDRPGAAGPGAGPGPRHGPGGELPRLSGARAGALRRPGRAPTTADH